MRLTRFAILAVASLTLLACGGGSGGNANAPGGDAPTTTWSVSPSTLTTSQELTLSTQTIYNVKSSTFFNPVYVQAIDPQNVVSMSQYAKSAADGSQFALRTSTRLAAGRYTGSVELRLCPVADCAQQHPGSPLRLPYDVTVVNPYQMPPLSRIPGLTDWETHQGNAAHTGYVPVSLDATKFSTRWRWQKFDGRTLVLPAVANDKVFVTTGSLLADAKLQALKESDGTLVWEVNAIPAMTTPLVSNGVVYQLGKIGSGEGALWAVNASDGTLRFRGAGFPARSVTGSQAPAVVGGKLYFNSVSNGNGGEGGTQSIDVTTGALAWTNSWADAYAFQAGTPAVDAQFAYASWTDFGSPSKTKVYAMDAVTGAVVKVTDLGEAGPTSDPVPVLASNGRLLVSDGKTLRMVQPLSGNIVWAVETWSSAIEPVVAGDTVFVANGLTEQLEARNLSTGSLLWAWAIDAALDQYLFSNMVVTDSHVFVSTRRATYAVDRNTHLPTWKYPMAGAKAISANGILYIATMSDYLPGFNPSSDGGLTAINLR